MWRGRTGSAGDPAHADTARRATAGLLARMAGVVREFGDVLLAETGTGGGPDEQRLAGALDALCSGRSRAEDRLHDLRSRAGLWELASALLTTVDRMLAELDPAGRERTPGPAADAVRARRAAVQAAERLRLPRRSPTRRAQVPPPGVDGDPR